ncbi:hypothetical protein BCR39DRAFT_355541 [Naematelia encephala]|uniref:Uncharacterized protein n=1 Tax=Naematelia encephala TaxID=71784 RepID=A0A1Y2BDE4_9TREE|nr:hypothetical protein BCR39DRAFT_355541 [Naematelia encephala]
MSTVDSPFLLFASHFNFTIAAMPLEITDFTSAGSRISAGQTSDIDVPVTLQLRKSLAGQTSSKASTRGRLSGDFIVAVTQDKRSGLEIGVAALDIGTGKMVITQIADTNTYDRIVKHLNTHPPATILAPDTAICVLDGSGKDQRSKTGSSRLFDILAWQFGLEAEPIAKTYWDRDTGADFVHKLACDDEQRTSTLMNLSDKYMPRSALRQRCFAGCKPGMTSRLLREA